MDIKLSLSHHLGGRKLRVAADEAGTRHLAQRGRKSGTGNSPGSGRNGGAEDVDFGPLEEWIGFNLRMAQDASFQAFSRRSQEIGVRPGRFATLTLIGRNPGLGDRV